MVGAGRFERPTPCAQGRCATRLRYAPTFAALLILNHFCNPRYGHEVPLVAESPRRVTSPTGSWHEWNTRKRHNGRGRACGTHANVPVPSRLSTMPAELACFNERCRARFPIIEVIYN